MANFVLTDIQQVAIALQETDEAGNATGTLPAGTTTTWGTSDPTVLTVTPAADGLSAVVAATGKLGTAVQVTVTATPPAPATPLTGVLTVDVIASAATSIGLLPGTPTTQPGK